ncbi:unnamed protein product [Pleuronectes platessa]|uniref:Uncharacterized protein n=1 Tax=Pleuronectes platessa TaxID=8262 RepID=A0A9N7V0B1_PLEPL|nr:unnamed protein product [Pleuronectes platessa]
MEEKKSVTHSLNHSLPHTYRLVFAVSAQAGALTLYIYMNLKDFSVSVYGGQTSGRSRSKIVETEQRRGQTIDPSAATDTLPVSERHNKLVSQNCLNWVKTAGVGVEAGGNQFSHALSPPPPPPPPPLPPRSVFGAAVVAGSTAGALLSLTLNGERSWKFRVPGQIYLERLSFERPSEGHLVHALDALQSTPNAFEVIAF